MKVGKIVQLNNDKPSAMVAYQDMPGHVAVTTTKAHLEELERDAEALKRVVAEIERYRAIERKEVDDFKRDFPEILQELPMNCGFHLQRIEIFNALLTLASKVGV